MSQHDFVIDNQNAPASRADINNALQALASLSSGATAPVATYANMLWYDTANDLLKIRNEANSAWITLGTVDQTNNVFNPNFFPATQAEAEAGTNNIKGMTPLRVAQAIAALAPSPLFSNAARFTASGTWVCPTGVTSVALVIVGAGANGNSGTSGSSGASGRNGGCGYVGNMAVVPGTSYPVTVGAASGGSSSFNGVTATGGTTSVTGTTTGTVDISTNAFFYTGIVAMLATSTAVVSLLGQVPCQLNGGSNGQLATQVYSFSGTYGPGTGGAGGAAGSGAGGDGMGGCVIILY